MLKCNLMHLLSTTSNQCQLDRLHTLVNGPLGGAIHAKKSQLFLVGG